MIRTLYLPSGEITASPTPGAGPPENGLRTGLSTAEIAAALEDRDGILWVDFVEEPPAALEPILRDVFHFHPLAIEDALREVHVPKVDDWNTYLYLVMSGMVYLPDAEDPIQPLELDVFLGSNYLVSYESRAIPTLERVFGIFSHNPAMLRQGPEYLSYRLADELSDDIMPIVEAMDSDLDRLEDEVFAGARAETLEAIIRYKRGVLQMRRILTPQRELMQRLSGQTYSVIDPQYRMFYRDVYDHLVRLHDISESLRDLATASLDTYLSVVNNRMNDIMRILTIFTALFMPITFLTGFFGMNFFEPSTPFPEWTSQPVFWLALALITALPLSMYVYIRRKGWM